MTEKKNTSADDSAARDFAAQVDKKPPGMVSEFWGLLRTNKKWWLTPIIVASILLGVLMLVLGTPLGPLIYTLF